MLWTLCVRRPSQQLFRLAVAVLGLAMLLFGAPAAAQTAPTTKSTFNSISIYWSPEGMESANRASVQYRPAGTSTFRQAQDLWYATAGTREYRGSIVNLTPGTTYDVKLSLAWGESVTTQVTTRSDRFPIARTVGIPGGSATLNVIAGGRADGYVLYDGTGATIDVRDRSATCVRVTASFVIVRGVVCKGAHRDGIMVAAAHDVVIEGVDVSGWGRLRKEKQSQRWAVHDDAAIYVGQDAERVLVQGSRLHHPRFDTNTWHEDGHPYGNVGIFVEGGNSGGHVFRYNEIYSDDDHLFEDGMRSVANFGPHGFPGPDSDIYGNMVSECADDGIEVDGGGMNIRVWGNYVDKTFVSISTAAVVLGPLYVFRNVLNRDAYGGGKPSWTMFKMDGREEDQGRKYFYHNTILGAITADRGLAINQDGPFHKVVTRNNILNANSYAIDAVGTHAAERSSFDYDMSNKGLGVTGGAEPHGILNTPTQWRTGHGPSSGAGGRYQLARGSPGYDGGVVLPNFNDDYEGRAPDIGAQEYGSPDMQFGTAAWRGPSDGPSPPDASSPPAAGGSRPPAAAPAAAPPRP
jgi:hypothetical protein